MNTLNASINRKNTAQQKHASSQGEHHGPSKGLPKWLPLIRNEDHQQIKVTSMRYDPLKT